MLNLLKYSYGRSLRLLALLLALSTMGSLGACSKVLPALLGGGGPNVAANTQVGKTNNQTIGSSSNNAPTVTVRPNSRVDTVDQSTSSTTNQELPTWVWICFGLLFIIGWVTDTPATYIRNATKGNKV